MATKVYTNSYFGCCSTGGSEVNLSGYLQDCVVTYQSEMLDETAMGDLTRARIGGLKTWSFACKFNEDYCSTGAPASTLWNLVGCQINIEWRPVNTLTTEINPRFFGVAAVDGCPIGGTVGTLAQETITFQSAGALTRSTTAT